MAYKFDYQNEVSRIWKRMNLVMFKSCSLAKRISRACLVLLLCCDLVLISIVEEKTGPFVFRIVMCSFPCGALIQNGGVYMSDSDSDSENLKWQYR